MIKIINLFFLSSLWASAAWIARFCSSRIWHAPATVPSLLSVTAICHCYLPLLSAVAALIAALAITIAITAANTTYHCQTR